jgi:hypothetical protein
MTQNMTTRTTKQLAVVGLAIFLAQGGVMAQDSHWNGTTNNTAWNVATNWNPVGVPFPGNPTTTFTGNVRLDPSPVDGDKVITVPAGDVETPGVGNSTEVFNTIFGPEFGCTLNVYGTLSWDWTIAPYQPDPTPGMRSHVNIYTNGYMYTTGASMNLGSGWWPVCEGTYVTMNLYDNANFSSLGGAGLWSGGHINIYDSSTFLANGYVNLDNGEANNDATTDFVVGGGTLMLPKGFNNSTVTNWITRGILRAYGKGFDTNDLIVTDNGTNTIVTAAPLNGALQRVYFQPLVNTSVTVGTFQQVTLLGDYPGVSGVLLSSSEPGLDPKTFSHPVYASSNPNVASVDTNGLLTAVNPGQAALTATVGAFTSTNTVSITVVPVIPNLVHRYSFKDTAGSTTAADSVGGLTWAGAVNGDAVLSGSNLVLSGNVGSSVTLPAGIVSGLDEITVEAWVDFPGAITAFANLYAFGASDGNGNGANAITFSPHTGATPSTFQANFAQGDPGFNGERDAVATGVLDNTTNLQIVVVYHPHAGYEAFYTNGVLVVQNSMFNNMIDPVGYACPAFTNVSILSYTLGTDPINYIGQSIYSTDPGLLANYSEFRIYNTPLTPAQIAADHALGPNRVIGTSTNVTLTASAAGGNVTIAWPTTSQLVSLVSSPVLGAGAVWTPVTAPMTAPGANYQVVMPASSTARFFRLTQ